MSSSKQYQETDHRLESQHCRELARAEKWEELIECMLSFTQPDRAILFMAYRHIVMDALYKKERAKALRIYETKLQECYEPSKAEHFKELKRLLDLADPREDKKFVEYWAKWNARNRLRGEQTAPLPLPHPEEYCAPRADGTRDRSGIQNVISQPSQCLSIKLPDEEPVRVTGLLYTNSGAEILALRADGMHNLWQWPNQKATASVLPNLRKGKRNPSMQNDIRDTYPHNSTASVALSRNDCYLLSTSGGAVSLFNTETFRNITTLLHPPPTPTCLAFDPDNSNIAAIGMEDSSIVIFDFGVLKVSCKLMGHHGRVTGLAFSGSSKVLVSCAVDGEIIVWSKDNWEKETSKQLQIPGVAASACAPAPTRLQFHRDQKQLLVIHKDHLTLFEAPRLECKMQWRPIQANDSITNATYSCDGQQVYVSQEGGNIVILTSSLGMQCRMHFTAYMAMCSSPPYPVMVAAHPSEPNQFALGLTDGCVYVIQPVESAGRWSETVFGPSTSETEHKKRKRKLASSDTSTPKRRSSTTREDEIRAANTTARVILCIPEYHKDDLISRGLNPSEKIIEFERDSEPNPGENLDVNRQLESGQTMQVHQGCDPKLSQKSKEKRLLKSSQSEQNPSENWIEKGQSSHK